MKFQVLWTVIISFVVSLGKIIWKPLCTHNYATMGRIRPQRRNF